MVIVANKTGQTDGSAFEMLKQIKTDIPIVLVSRSDNFVFNEELKSLDKYVLVSFFEFGWDYNWENRGHVFGNSFDYTYMMFRGIEWHKFNEWVYTNPPILTLQRELHKNLVRDNVLPIEYPNLTNPYPKQSYEEFNNRPIDLLFYWGRSNEKRVQTHGDLWKGASEHGYSVSDNIYYFNEFMKEEKGRKIVSLNIPHYGRIDVSNLLAINNMSKLSLSLPGAGIKCFRSTGESIVNSVMVCEEDELAWTYPLVHGENCIKIYEPDTVLQTVNEALKRKDLYQIYLNSLELADKYRLPNYLAHLENTINNA